MIEMVLSEAQKVIKEPDNPSVWGKAIIWPLSILSGLCGGYDGVGFWSGIIAIVWFVYWICITDGWLLLALIGIYIMGVVWHGFLTPNRRSVCGKR